MLNSLRRRARVANCLVCLALILSASSFAHAVHQVTDATGRSVTVPDQPKRIICLSPSLTETVYALGLGDVVVGRTDYSDFPREVLPKASVGGIVNPSVEKILSLTPDLILADAGINRQETVEQLEHVGATLYIVHPQGLQGVLDAIEQVGDATGRAIQSMDLVAKLKEKRARIAARVAGAPQPSVFVVVWYDPVITAGGKAFITEILAAAGARSATADLAQSWPQLSMEDVLRRAPDYLLLFRGGHSGVTVDDLKANPGWNQLAAVRLNHVIYADEQLEHSSPEVFLALEKLAATLHPEAFRP